MQTLFPLHFSSSSLTLVHECRFKWFRRYCQHLAGVHISPDLHAGGLFATACELTRKAYYNDGIDEDDAIKLGKAFILASDSVADGIKTNERIAYVFEKYFKHYSNSSILPAKLIDGSHAIEYKFEIDTGIAHPELPERTIHFTGKLDMVGHNPSASREEYFVVDEKTTKSVFRVTGSKIPDLQKIRTEYLCRGQFIGYVYACHKLGLPVSKALVRKVPIMTTYEPPFDFDIHVSEAMLKWWEMSTFSTIEDLVERYKWYKANDADIRSVFTPVYSDACHSWGRPCSYYQGCTIAEGDEILAMTMPQMVGYPLVDSPMPLQDYLNTLR